MFSKKNPGSDAGPPAGDGAAGAGDGAPPLKPFAASGSGATSAPAATQTRSSFHPDIPSRSPDIPGLPPRRAGERPNAADAAKTLMVGGAIHLKGGEISNCERLVVEGQIEDSSVTDANRVEILSGGTFKGKADVDEAIVSGHFDGQLTVRARLTVRETGRITGSVRYGSIVIEPGGEIRGDMQTLSSTATGAASADEDSSG